jgi:hypothetical protein
LTAIGGGRLAAAAGLAAVLVGLSAAILLMLLFLIARIVLRRQWLAAAAFVLVFEAVTVFRLLSFVGHDFPVSLWIAALALTAVGELVGLVVLLRFGLLAAVGMYALGNLLAAVPMTLDPGRPYFPAAATGLLLVAGFGVWAFRTSLAGRPVLGDLLAD